jgi:hypothetical protein
MPSAMLHNLRQARFLNWMPHMARGPISASRAGHGILRFEILAAVGDA